MKKTLRITLPIVAVIAVAAIYLLTGHTHIFSVPAHTTDKETVLEEVKNAGTIEKEAETEMLNRINALRTDYELNTLVVDPVLYDVAAIRAKELSVKWSHTRPDGTQGLDLIPLSYTLVGENLSKCQYGPETYDVTFKALKESVSHMANMIEPAFNNIGIAAYYDEQRNELYIAYCFGT